MNALVVIHIPLVYNIFVLFSMVKAVVPMWWVPRGINSRAQFATLFLPTHFVCLLMYFS